MLLTLDSCIERRANLISTRVGNELVMLDAEENHYLTLNDIGTEIWDRLAEPIVVRELCDDLARRFEVSADRCASDVLAFLADLERRSLLVERRSDPPAPVTNP